MTRVLRIIGLAVACGLAGASLTGCGSGAAGLADTETSQEMTRLRQILYKAPALPDGFSVRPRAAWRPPFKAADRDCRAVFDTAGGRAPTRALVAQAAATFQGDVLGEVAAVGLASYSGEEAEWHLKDLGKSLDGCPGLEAAKGTEFRESELPVGELGDEAVGAQFRGRLNGYPYALNLVLVRQGDTIISLVHTGLAKVDAKRTQSLARAVVGMAD
ncbi:hypothetical protein ACIBG8_52255 [Nonomuraea sp. NPDC050556]|uniref:hypothetical protein n=1 Tax=Nonomuraea sp. NPDC050556 TaxID=3364369 RepID=UPI00378E1446